LAAMAVRLVFIFGVTDPHNAGVWWYGDTYHRWQVAYLTREVGWSHGHRLWDLKGMEYFWGVVHPLLMNLLFTLTGRADIWLGRLLTATAGAGSAALLYLLGKRYWNQKMGLAVGFFAVFFPLGILNETSGSVEFLCFFFFLAGIWYWPKKPFFTGLLFALAAMTRADAWVLALALLVFLVAFSGKLEKAVMAAISFLVPVVVYMKYLGDKTGNYIYPIYWNYLANAKGVWSNRPIPDAEEAAARPFFILFLALFAAGVVWILWRRRKNKEALLLVFGFGYGAFIMGMMGLTSYLLSYEYWFWMIRFFVLPYTMAALVLAWGLFVWLPKRVRGQKGSMVGVGAWLGLILLTQLAWQPVMARYKETVRIWEATKRLGERMAQENIKRNEKILITAGAPELTYSLVRFGKIPGRQIAGMMYDPFYYMEGDPFADWQTNRQVVYDWFRTENIRWILMQTVEKKYDAMIGLEPENFEQVFDKYSLSYSLYRIKF